MNRRCIIIFLSLCLLTSIYAADFSITSVEAAPVPRTPGVKAGDKVRYGDFLALWETDYPDAITPQNFLDANNTLWVEDTVLEVSGSNITYETLTHYRNGTEKTRISHVDVITGSGSGNLSFVSADLIAGDRIYAIGELSESRMNATIPATYAGLTRETNLLNITEVILEFTTAFWSEFYWDKATGFLVEHFWSYAKMDEQNYLALGSIRYKMIDTNIWIGEHVQDDVTPVAVAGPDLTVDSGANTTFDASNSRDNIGIARFAWDFGDGSTATGMKVWHVYDRSGVFNVTLTVEDGKHNADVDFLAVTVRSRETPIPSWMGPVGLVLFLAILVSIWVLLRRR